MGIPELYHDETIILQAHNIKVKSVVFDAVLTNNRLILIDSKKGLIPPQEILLPAISTVDGGENAIRDPILTFTIIAKGSTARQMILTFPREASGEILKRFSAAGPAGKEAVFTELGKFFSRERGFGDITDINTVDGIRIFFSNGDIAHIRPSGNAPQLRIYSNADTQDRAHEIVNMGISEPGGILRELDKFVK